MSSNDNTNDDTLIRVAIVSPDPEARELLRSQINATGRATVQAECEEYFGARTDHSVWRLKKANLDVVVVDLQNPEAAVQSLEILNAVLPLARLVAISAVSDPAIVIECMRAGAREFLRKGSSAEVARAFERFSQEKIRQQETVPGEGKIYSVMSAKGGSGATFLAINLAVAISAQPLARVGLIDLNTPVGDAAVYLDLRPQFTLADVLTSLPKLDQTLLEMYMVPSNGIMVLSSPNEIGGPHSLPAPALARILGLAGRMFTHVVLDVPATMEEEQMKIIAEMSAAIVVVLTPELPALCRTVRLIQYLESFNAGAKLRIVLNRSLRNGGIPVTEIEEVLKHSLYWQVPNDYSAALQAINTGKPLTSLHGSEIGRSYADFTRQLCALEVPVKPRSLWRFLGIA